MLRGIVNRAVGAVLVSLFIVMIGGCGSSSGPIPATRADTATLSGSVIGEDQLPLLEARVRVGSIIANVDKFGKFVVTVQPGRYERSVAADGYQSYSDTITVVAGDNDGGAVSLSKLPPLPRDT